MASFPQCQRLASTTLTSCRGLARSPVAKWIENSVQGVDHRICRTVSVAGSLLPAEQASRNTCMLHLWAQSRSFASRSSPARGPKEVYEKGCASGEFVKDECQIAVVNKLDALAQKLEKYTPPEGGFKMGTEVETESSTAGGFLSSLFGGGTPKPKAKPKPVAPKMPPGAVQGLYIWGGCGSGKSFLMDMFYENINVEKKRRVHFHEWMIEVHSLLHKFQKSNAQFEKANTVWTAEAAKAQRESLQSKQDDKAASADTLVERVAAHMLSQAWLLCFDEFQVTHISDAIIMKRLFEILFSKGAVVVSTSNRPPEDLYLNGLNRPLFVPFIPLLKAQCEIYDIASAVDYRLITEYAEDAFRVFFCPLSESNKELLEKKFQRLSKQESMVDQTMTVQGRKITVPRAAKRTNVAMFSFADLCDKPLGAADYLAVATAFHTIFLIDIPKLTLQERDQVRRFITVIDTFYEKKVKLIVNADSEAQNIFTFDETDKKTAIQDEIFAWDRTVSRLIEMQSKEYLSKQTQDMDNEQYWSQLDLNQLTDEDIDEIWMRYETSGDEVVDEDELRILLTDLLSICEGGSRVLSDELFDATFEELDKNGDGVIQRDELRQYVKKFGVKRIQTWTAD